MDFQTPSYICEYMANYLPNKAGLILEPTAGEGNLVKALSKKGDVIAPLNFFDMSYHRFDWVVMNPPFTPMALGYKILFKCMEISDHIIALMPWLVMINSERRTKHIIDYGLRSITHLPRSVFRGSRVQTCILEMEHGYNDEITFKVFSNLNNQEKLRLPL